MDIKVNSSANNNILIIGAGEAGGRIAQEFSNHGFSKVIAINTAKTDLDGLDFPDDRKYLINEVSDGQGAGKNPEKVRQAIDSFYPDTLGFIQKWIDGVTSCYVLVGGGGGSGGGLGLVLAQIAGELGLPVGVIYTLPRQAEGGLVFYNALKNLREMHENAKSMAISPLIIVDNNKLTDKFESTAANFWGPVNSAIVEVIKSFNEFSQRPSKHFSALDGEDLKRLLSKGGACAIGSFDIAETDSEEALVKRISESFFMDGFNLTTAQAAGVIVLGSQKTLETSSSSRFLKIVLDQTASLIGDGFVFSGVYDEENIKFLRAYVIFNGLKLPDERIKTMMESVRNSYDKMKSKENRIGDGIFLDTEGDVESMFGDAGPSGKKIVRPMHTGIDRGTTQDRPAIQINQPKANPGKIDGVKRKER
jgi:cell division GTPase FtsZ